MTDPHAHHHDPSRGTREAPVGSHAAEHGGHHVNGMDHPAGHDPHGEHDHPGGHAGHGADHVARFRRLFWINLILAVPVVAFSSMFAMLFGHSLPDVPGINLIDR